MPKRKPAAEVNPADLSPAQVVAIATAFKEKQVSQAKGSLKDNSTHPVDFTARFVGNVGKGTSTKDSVQMVRPTLSLSGSFSVFCATLRALGIGTDRLGKALRSLPPLAQIPVDGELSAVFDEVAAELVKKLPDEKRKTAGKSGSVTSTITATKVVPV